ncbi:type VII secretion protein EssC [Paenibacillus sp. L3-i20]|uniref:type VII secretion protein EssC n=1 Tax=Paenibacillus sp. L3-i20 TaxID=2905833 RepID=UPI001EDEC482|nr:type VII secretion protein EssC [Paenibacillus sp. L3-i20]GKU77583.1 type VII secretion protein EssC [Paenibacillus sp. L3-i20]
MQLSLLKENVLYTCVLPERQKGQYWVTQINDDGYEERVIGVEGVEGKWILKSNKHATLVDQNHLRIKELVLEPQAFYGLTLNRTNERAWLYSEPVTDDRKKFTKLQLPAEGRLVIGRAAMCDMCYSNLYTSSKHAELVISANELSIQDLGSSNGTFVNGSRVNHKILMPGDVIYIMGLKIIVGKGFISVNNPDGQLTYNRSMLFPFSKQSIIRSEDDEAWDDEVSIDYFYRSPRFKREAERTEFKIDSPPALGNQEPTPLLLMLGPSLTMGMSALFMGFFTVQNTLKNTGNITQAMPSVVMSISMLLGAILWPILTRRHEAKKREEREKLRQEKYKHYLEEMNEKIIAECEHQSEILRENHTALDHTLNRIRHRQRNLWERTFGQDDFLKMRLGIGTLPLNADIKVQEKSFSLEDDNLIDGLYELTDEPKTLENVPVTLSLVEDRISGIIGSRNSVIDMTKGLILQLASLHSYDELKFVFIYDRKEQHIWDFAKWLPHVWNSEPGIRFIATQPNEVKEMSVFLEKEFARRESATSKSNELDEMSPYYVIFAMNKELATRTELLGSIYKHKNNLGVSVVHLYDELMNLPKECSIVVESDRNLSKIFDRDDISGQYVGFQPDFYLKQDERELAVNLANLKLHSSDANFALPTMMTFLDMFRVGKIEHLNALTRWKENDPTTSLEAAIGVDPSGELFKLDLHEKYHGPHGLIAGMTGSGKSEFIMTYILSLAVNYHPHEVAFILIDYKGGGMANAFTQLPHLAGTITNLDGAAVKRSLISIQSELKRRQAIFSETSKKVNTSNIDIYKYQKLYREGLVNEPLQHLFMISDEFAELKTQQPEFMEQLISAARIGRSLGVHLILATQKPAGVVDDQIWSNSKFRICLKVQEKADSMDMIKRPDAAELSITGRYYVQVGFNELFELGQSAWAGAPYYPADRVEKHKDESIVIIDNLGRPLKQVKSDKRKSVSANPPKQIDEINKYLADIAKEEGITVKPLWLDPIPEFIFVDDLKSKYDMPKAKPYWINPTIGEVDDPASQRQFGMTLPLSQEGNVIVYGSAGNGKTTFLTSLIYSIMTDHTPEEVQMYILDFGSETLKAFSKAPHVGDVLLAHDVEKINNLFKMLYKEIESRKKLFSDYGGDYHSYIRATKSGIESIIVMIHNYAAFAETYEEKEDAISYLTREGVKYGIYFIFTALNSNAVRFRILPNFKQLLVLQFNDSGDYSSVLGNVEGIHPSKLKGRGIMKTDRVYEFQIAHVFKEVEQTLDRVREYCSQYAQKWSGTSAKRIPILPDKIDVPYLDQETKSTEPNVLPIGVEKNSLQLANFSFNRYISLVLSQNNEESSFIQGISEIIASYSESKLIVIDADGLFEPDEQKQYEYMQDEKQLDHMVLELFNILVSRNNSYKDAKDADLPTPEFQKITCIIHSLSSLMSKVSDDSKDKLKILLEKGSLAYNVNFIISDAVSAISAFTYEEWFKAHVSTNDGIWIGNNFSDQYQLKVNKMSSEFYQEIGDQFGYSIVKGKATLVKLVSSITAELEVDMVG